MYNIQKEIENEIIGAINTIIDQYLEGRTFGTQHARNVMNRKDYDSYFDGKMKTIFDAKKDFRKQSSITKLIEDIHHAGYQLFAKNIGGDTPANSTEYRKLVVELLNDILKDRMATEKDKKVMENVKDFDKYFENQIKKLYEVNLPAMKIDEILDDVSQVTNDTLKKVLVTQYKTYNDYIDLTDKKKHLFKIHDMVGDIMNNNRVSFDACIFDAADIKQIKVNLVDFSIGEFHNQLPNNLNIFGIDVKPSSFINKEELKVVFDEIFLPEEVVKIVSSILNFKYEGQNNNFYIWSNKQ